MQNWENIEKKYDLLYDLSKSMTFVGDQVKNESRRLISSKSDAGEVLKIRGEIKSSLASKSKMRGDDYFQTEMYTQ